ncbi:MAG: hypothetical protein OEZ34_16515, partial [Spirochaetia bacterium]|nr:hypothetical protein [Spirochaetia bacterium]
MHIKSLFNRDGIFGFIGLFLFFCGLFLVLTPPHHNSYFIFHKDQPYTTADFILYSSMRELSGHDAAKQNYIQEQYENFNSTDALSLEDIVLLKTGFLFFPWLILLISIPLILYALYFRRLENMLLPIVNSIRKSGEVILADLAFTYGLT